jgi:hypothetical protein
LLRLLLLLFLPAQQGGRVQARRATAHLVTQFWARGVDLWDWIREKSERVKKIRREIKRMDS